MRLLRLTTVPQDYWTQYFCKHKVLAGLSIAEQMAAVFGDHFAQADSYGIALTKRGYECKEAIANIGPVLRSWAGSEWPDYTPRQHAQRFALSLVREHRPDILWLNDFTLFDQAWIEAARGFGARRMLVCSWCGVEPRSLGELAGPDCILTSNEPLARMFRTAGLQVAVVPFAFDPRILQSVSSDGLVREGLSFLGTVRRKDGFHATRARTIEALADSLPISVYSASKADGAVRRAASAAASVLCSALQGIGLDPHRQSAGRLRSTMLRLADERRLKDNHPVWRDVRPPVYGLQMYRVLAGSLVTLNVHAECAGEMTGNIRLFEATGVGTCLLTDAKSDIREFFEPDKEVVTFSSPAECVERAKWLLDNPDSSARIGRAGQARTLGQHTYDHRAEILDHLLRRNHAGL